MNELLRRAFGSLLAELFDGPAETGSWVLDRADVGLLGELEKLPAAVVSQRPMPGQTTIAAHANHLRFALDLLNRWAGGEENPFAAADWPGSWRLQSVSESEWHELLAQLKAEAHAWNAALRQPREWDEIALTGAIGSVAHVAYHLGAIRQLIAASGPTR